jgi:hypothetical protein
MEYALIEWGRRCYPGVKVDVFGNTSSKKTVTIATTDMLENMVTEDGYFVSQKAEEVDAGITLYVPPNEIYSSEHDLVELVENEMKKQ